MEAVKNSMVVVSSGLLWDGIYMVTVQCADSDVLKALPAGITFEGRTYGKTGWNSDSSEAYYRTDRKFATGVK